MKIISLLFAIVLLTMTLSCKHVVQYDCTGVAPTYTNNIKPILDAACATEHCHTSGHASSGIDLSTYAGSSAASNKKSFMGSIQHKPFYQKMPKNQPIMADAEIHLLYCWIQNGSPE